MSELREMFQVGNKVRQKTVSSPKGRLLHVLAIIDDDQVVYKYWSYKRQFWSYQVCSFGFFQIYLSSGWLEAA